MYSPGPAVLAISAQNPSKVSWEDYKTSLKERLLQLGQGVRDPAGLVNDAAIDLLGQDPAISRLESFVESPMFLGHLEQRFNLNPRDFPLELQEVDSSEVQESLATWVWELMTY